MPTCKRTLSNYQFKKNNVKWNEWNGWNEWNEWNERMKWTNEWNEWNEWNEQMNEMNEMNETDLLAVCHLHQHALNVYIPRMSKPLEPTPSGVAKPCRDARKIVPGLIINKKLFCPKNGLFYWPT